MIIQTKQFKEAVNTLLTAVSVDTKNVTEVEIVCRGTDLYLNTTNKEYFVSIKYKLDEEIEFRAVVDASLFLNLISGITTETFTLEVNDQLLISTGKSKYKIPLKYTEEMPFITLVNKSVEMTISNDILMSILNVNRKELEKTKYLNVDELQRLYYLDENGCFTFTNGACVNSFKLEKPVKLLLNDKLVKLFKLFKTDVSFSFGHDALPNGFIQTKAVFKSDSIYLAAIVNADEKLLYKIQGPANVVKHFMEDNYSNKLIISVKELNEAITRILTYKKNKDSKANMLKVYGICTFDNDNLVIKDEEGNIEYIKTSAGSIIDTHYAMTINLADLKLVLDSCKDDCLNMSCGNHRSVVLARGNITNVIPERVEGD